MNIVSSHICCYCFHYLYSWLFLTIILHTQFSLHLYLKPFFFIQIPHKIRFKSKIHTRGDEERRKTRKTKKPLRSSKRTVWCFGEGIPLNLLTLIQVSAILSDTQSDRQLANRLGLCSRSGLLVRAETASTCWVFTSKFFRSESDSGVFRRWFFKFWTIRLSRQVHGLRNRCTFALDNGLTGIFISRYWVSLIGFDLCPFRELVWHLSTQVNIGNLAV